MQVITSLLGLQARSIKDSSTRKKFEESRYRIQAIAILHEILYESASLAEIDFADYIRNDEPDFDYKMRPGIVQHSNALALMRKVGLEV